MGRPADRRWTGHFGGGFEALAPSLGGANGAPPRSNPGVRRAKTHVAGPVAAEARPSGSRRRVPRRRAPRRPTQRRQHVQRRRRPDDRAQPHRGSARRACRPKHSERPPQQLRPPHMPRRAPRPPREPDRRHGRHRYASRRRTNQPMPPVSASPSPRSARRRLAGEGTGWKTCSTVSDRRSSSSWSSSSRAIARATRWAPT